MPLKPDSEPYVRMDYKHNKWPKCPHCDTEIIPFDHDLYELYEEREQEIDCPYCEQPFIVESMAIWTFSTSLKK